MDDSDETAPRRGTGPAIAFRSVRLALHETRPEDADELFDALTPAVARFMAWELPVSRAVHRARVVARAAAEDEAGIHLVIRRRADGRCLGAAAVERLDADTPEIGLWLRECAWGRGYGTEAVRALLIWARKRTGHTSFAWPVAPANAPSVRLVERLGGKIAGRRRQRRHHSIVYLVPAPAQRIGRQ